MLEPGTGEVFEIPVDIQTFHEHELVEQADAVAAYSFFRQWLSSGGSRPTYDQCVTYKVPLFLGGADQVTNLEIADFEVCWSITADLLAQVRGLPIGTKIGKVTLTGN